MRTDLEDQLRAALRADAERSPVPPLEWTPRPSAEPQLLDRGRRRGRLLVLAASAAAVAVVGVWSVVNRSTTPDRVASEPSVTNDAQPATSGAVETTASTSAEADVSAPDVVFVDNAAPLVVGGPVVADAAPRLEQAGLAVEASPAPSLDDLTASIERVAVTGELPASIVIDPTIASPTRFDEADLNHLAGVLSDATHVVLVASNDSGAITEANNALLRSIADAADNMSVLDWPAATESCWCAYGNRLDLREDGETLYAHLVSRQLDPAFDVSARRSTLEELQQLLPQVEPPPRMEIAGTELWAGAGEGRNVTVFGAPDQVCVSAADPAGSSGSGCTSDRTTGLLFLSLETEDRGVILLHHPEVSVHVSGCDVRTVVLGTAVWRCRVAYLPTILTSTSRSQRRPPGMSRQRSTSAASCLATV